MSYLVTISAEFCAAMQLAMPGDCNKLHGHTYIITAEFSAESLNEYGIAIDYYDLQAKLDNIVKQIDHCYLNEHAWFQDLTPSSENIAFVVFHKLKEFTKEVNLIKVSVQESKNCVVSYVE